MKRKHITIIIIVAIVGLIVYQLSSNKKELNAKNNPAPAPEISIPVKAATAVEKELQMNILKTGSLAPFIEAKVLSTGSGTVKQLYFKLGDKVVQGQPLIVLDTRLLQLDLQKSESNVAKLRNDVQTYQELLEGKAATREKVNELRQSYSDAVNESKQIRKQIADASIKSPTTGVIAQKTIEEGVYVNSGAELATVINLSKAKVQVSLTEAEVYQIKVGQPVKITTEVYKGKTFAGTVTFISPQADETRSYQVEIMVTNPGGEMLRSGTFVYADFSKKTTQQMLMIPREALTESVQNASVYVIQGNSVRLQEIKTGQESEGLIAVTDGLKAGDVVVVSGQINLKNGTKVSISK
ncbi:membrane fusion protein; possible cation efflux system protein [Pedobacter sp. BAL39]|uniref:efflux RND transporter periplasmic adaptor subunit n=1 Tax=Pedobacter sp. BAL39 TaxID=391596 RepID=UPI000155924F|nr:efflux RND transporter periplasmic adaptor subunit [Pedobacter sp. BAL39]EDM35163.1 membrane fusion protein; possible cation efflux system protein [Pedobacter sp. BAL39]